MCRCTQGLAPLTLTPGASMGTSTMDCCLCAGALVSLLPMKMQILQRGSHAPLVHLWCSSGSVTWQAVLSCQDESA
jgi:hypothetical protein